MCTNFYADFSYLWVLPVWRVSILSKTLECFLLTRRLCDSLVNICICGLVAYGRPLQFTFIKIASADDNDLRIMHLYAQSLLNDD